MCLITVVICHISQRVRDSVCPLNADVALQQQLPSANHSAKVHGTSLFRWAAGKSSYAHLAEARRAAGAEVLPAAPWGQVLSGGQGCAWNGPSSHSCHQHSSCCAERKGWSTADVRGAFLLPRAPAPPQQPLPWVGSAAAAALPSIALGCTGFCFKTSHKNFS